MMKTIVSALVVLPLLAGCQSQPGGSGGGTTQYEQLMDPVSARQMTGGVLVFNFQPVNRDTKVVVDVQATLSSVDPLFHVVEGTVDYDEYLGMNPADVINVPYDRSSNRMIGDFVPYSLDTFTLFILDNSAIQGAYSVKIYQQIR